MITRRDFRIALPNEPGQLARVCEALCNNGINIRTIAGIAGSPPLLAIITDQEDATEGVLKELGLDYQVSELLTVKFENIPGEVATFSRKLADQGINISAVYLLGESSGRGMIAFSVSDLEKARKVLSEHFQ